MVNGLWKKEVSQNFGEISQVLQSRFLRGSERLAVSIFWHSQCGVWISVLQSKDLKKSWSCREKRWSHIYRLPPLIYMPSIHCIASFFPEIVLILCFEPHTSSVPNLHNRENLNISGREEGIKKTHPSFCKAFWISLFFNILFFSFHRHFKVPMKQKLKLLKISLLKRPFKAKKDGIFFCDVSFSSQR